MHAEAGPGGVATLVLPGLALARVRRPTPPAASRQPTSSKTGARFYPPLPSLSLFLFRNALRPTLVKSSPSRPTNLQSRPPAPDARRRVQRTIPDACLRSQPGQYRALRKHCFKCLYPPPKPQQIIWLQVLPRGPPVAQRTRPKHAAAFQLARLDTLHSHTCYRVAPG